MEIYVPTSTSTSASGIWNVKTVRNSIMDFSWPREPIAVRYVIVAGGGGGGSDMGGGGGGGGVLTGSNFMLAPGRHSIVVGNGGAGAPAGVGQPRGSNGGNSSAFGLTAIGGGGGASCHDRATSPAGDGGSGGGGSGGRGTNVNTGGAPGTGTSGQGFNGANSGTQWYPGGGGGAGRVGGVFDSLGVTYYTNPSLGGKGVETDILRDGTPYGKTIGTLWFGGGGGGSGYSTSGGAGGMGGGGGGAVGNDNTGDNYSINGPGLRGMTGVTGAWANCAGGNGGANSGGGGGGGSHYNADNFGGNGGSGVVIVRYDGIQKFIGGTVFQWAERSTPVGQEVVMQSSYSLRTVHIFYESGELVG